MLNARGIRFNASHFLAGRYTGTQSPWISPILNYQGHDWGSFFMAAFLKNISTGYPFTITNEIEAFRSPIIGAHLSGYNSARQVPKRS